MSCPWVAIDFETATGARASACALGLVVIEDDRVVEERDWLIRPPGNEYSWFNTRIHGIDAARTADEPEFTEVWPEIARYLHGATFLAHNAPFDAGVLRGELARNRLATPASLGYHCTVTLARKTWPEHPRHRLPDVCERCGIELNHHDAASDASACARIALHCLRLSGQPSLDALVRSLGMSPGRL